MILRNARTIRYCRTLPHGNLPTWDHKDLYSRQNAIGSDAPDHNEFPPRKLLERLGTDISPAILNGFNHGFPWISIKFHGFPSSFMDFHQVSWFFHQFPHFVSIVWWPPKQKQRILQPEICSGSKRSCHSPGKLSFSGSDPLYHFLVSGGWWTHGWWAKLGTLGMSRVDEMKLLVLYGEHKTTSKTFELHSSMRSSWHGKPILCMSSDFPKLANLFLYFIENTHTQLFISCSSAQVTSNPARTAPGKSGNLTIKQSCGFLLAHNIGYHKIIHIEHILYI